MELKDHKDRLLSINMVHSYPVYGGWYEGYPTPEDNARGIESAKKNAKKLSYMEPIIYMENLEQEKILPPWAHIVWFKDIALEKQISIVWFDEYGTDPVTKLNQILRVFDWEEHASEWAF